MTRRDEYVAQMEVQLDRWTARLGAVQRTPLQSEECKRSSVHARAQLVELKGTNGYVWELRRDAMEKTWLKLETMLD